MVDLSSPRCVLAVLLAAVALGVQLGACSFIVEHGESQCQTNAECARFPGTRCDAHQGVCVAGDGGADAACDGGGDGGC